MRVLFDENVPKLLVDHFRYLSVDLKTVNELNLTHYPDSEVVRRSNKLRRTLVTRDIGLIKLTSYSDATKFGLILIRYNDPVTLKLVKTITDFVRNQQNKSIKDTLIVISEDRYEVFKGRFYEYKE